MEQASTVLSSTLIDRNGMRMAFMEIRHFAEYCEAIEVLESSDLFKISGHFSMYSSKNLS